MSNIFVLSLHRSGTQSVHDLLVRSGISAIHWPVVVAGIDYQREIIGKEDDLSFIADTLAPVFATTTAVSDVPIPALYDILDGRYPDARFLAIYRESSQWVQSVRRHIKDRAFDPYEKALYHRYLPARPDRVTSITDDDLIGMHDRHYQALQRHFSGRSNFALFDLDDEALGERICRFLGLQPTELKKIDYRRPELPANFRDEKATKYAIITPYFKETRRTLERCLESVRTQTIKADHIVVADGVPQAWLDAEPVRHVVLDRSHADYGNTPRTIGGLLAVSEEYQGIGFLDADNWLAQDHVERCVEAASQARGNCDFVIARRQFMRPDETKLDLEDAPPSEHIDTNCFFFLKGSYHTLHHWITIPRRLSIASDRVFYLALKNYQLQPAFVQAPTVYYECLWLPAYLSLGEAPPANAKPPIDPGPLFSWLQSLSDRELQIVNRLSGSISWRSLHVSVALNTPCPCGSGKMFRHCHGQAGAPQRARPP